MAYLAQLVTAARIRQENRLWASAGTLRSQQLGATAPLLRVHGDLHPAADVLIIAPLVQLLPNIIVAAEDFMSACTHLDTMQVQLQLGRSAVFDQVADSSASIHYTHCIHEF